MIAQTIAFIRNIAHTMEYVFVNIYTMYIYHYMIQENRKYDSSGELLRDSRE